MASATWHIFGFRVGSGNTLRIRDPIEDRDQALVPEYDRPVSASTTRPVGGIREGFTVPRSTTVRTPLSSLASS